MAKARVSVSSAESFRNVARSISATVSDAASEVSVSLHEWQVQIGAEIERCNNLWDRIAAEIYALQSEIDSIDEQISSLEARLASIDPYIEYEWTDDDGNTHTERVPNPEYTAIRAEIAELQAKKQSLSFKLSQLRSLQYEVEAARGRLKSASSRIEGIDGNIDSSVSEVQEYAERAEKLLGNIIEALGAYLSVKIHTGAAGGGSAVSAGGTSVGIGSGGASVGTGSSGASVNPASGAGTYVGADGTRVTPLETSAGASTDRKYTDGVVYEGRVAFEHGNTKHTVDIKRKIYQYAPGIDLDYVRPDGRTNREAMLKGEAPIVLVQTKNGILQTKLDLHHVTQQETIGFPGAQFKQGTLLEIPVSSHQKYTGAIHMRYPTQNGIRRSFRVTKMADHTYKRSMDDKQFNAFRKQYWRTRALMGA